MSWTMPSLRQLTLPASVVLMVAAGAWAGVAVVFVPGLAPGMHHVARPGQMGGM